MVAEEADRVGVEELSRPKRNRRMPARFGEFVTNFSVGVADNWEKRVETLIMVLAVFPEGRADILACVLRVIEGKCTETF